MAAVQTRTMTVAHVLNGTDTLRKTARMFTWGSQRPMHGVANIKSLVANNTTEFKVLTFRTY